MGMIERLKAQDQRHAELDKRVSDLEAALAPLLASLVPDDGEEDNEAEQESTLDGVFYTRAERDQGKPL